VKLALVVSCEHGGNRVPARYRAQFAAATKALASHRGWDAGALTFARELARALGAPLFACTTTRLLIDLNRSLGHPRLFSEWSRELPAIERDALVERWWRPHRAALEDFILEQSPRRVTVLHLSVHSFTPRWQGRARPVDVGLLYDPARDRERGFARAWQRSLQALRSELRVRRNQPYRGNADGLTSALRERFPEQRYLGLELELSQRFPRGDAAAWRLLRRAVVQSLQETLQPTVRARWSTG